MENKTRNKVKQICLTGLMAALITVFTAFVKMPTGINSGYIHFGDSMIYLSGCLLGPWASLAAAIGGGMADVLAGAPQWALPTAIVKSINALPFFLVLAAQRKAGKPVKILSLPTVLMSVVSGVWTMVGYFIAEGLMYSFPAAIPSIPFNAVQAVGSTIVFVLVGAVLDRIKIIKYL